MTDEPTNAAIGAKMKSAWSRGGRNGTGAAKRRTAAQCRMAALAMHAKRRNRQRKAQRAARKRNRK